MAIDKLLFVTGAGASYHLGMNNEKMPLMRDWCANLIQRLNAGPWPGVPATLGLTTADLDGFEAHIGHFLAWQRSLATAGELIDLGAVAVTAAAGTDPVRAWFNAARDVAAWIEQVIHESLFDQYSAERTSAVSATQAYRKLFSDCAVESSTAVAYVTTNYDVAGEQALIGLGRHPNWGEQPSFDAASRPIRVTGLSAGWTEYQTPVLHLHGRVGWYIDDTDTLISVNPAGKLQTGLGRPGLLLPDLDKDYGQLPAINDMWTEFELLLEQASHILVLGHSLHDRKLVDALTSTSRPIAVTALNQAENSDRVKERERIQALIPRAEVLYTNFAPDNEFVLGDPITRINWRGQ